MKKCRPATRARVFKCLPISPIGKVDVLLVSGISGRASALELGEQLVLERQVLGRGLDHELHLLPRQVARARHGS